MSIYTCKDFFRLIDLMEADHGHHSDFDCQILTLDGNPVTSACGAEIKADGSISDATDYDLIIVSPVEGPQLKNMMGNSAEFTMWLKRQIELKVPTVALTSGVYFLAETGCVDGHVLATHWAFVRYFQSQFPNCTFTSQHTLTGNGRIFTTSTLSGTSEALLAYLSVHKGDKFAQLCAAYFSVSGPEQVEPVLFQYRNHVDEHILKVQNWIENNFNQCFTIEQLGKKFGFSERNLKRRFRVATGVSINHYMQELRLAKAKSLLIATDNNVKQIAYEVGYQNDSFFSRLFRKSTGKTPAQWRQKSSFKTNESTHLLR